MSNILKYTFAMLFSVLLAGCSDEASNPPAPTPEPEPEEVIKNGSLKGTIIGTEWSVDYNNGNSITDQVNVKATTEEKLGFTGQELGISAHAVCLLEKL